MDLERFTGRRLDRLRHAVRATLGVERAPAFAAIACSDMLRPVRARQTPPDRRYAAAHPAASGTLATAGGGWRARTVAWLPAAAALAVFAARVVSLYDRHLIVDDAFISFRYADNLAHGLGLVYNPGERVEGYSNFLWTLILAAAARLGMDIVRCSIALALASAVATLLLLAAWSRALFAPANPPASGRNGDGLGAEGASPQPAASGDAALGLLFASLPPLLYAAMGSQARYVVSGMETLFFGFLVLAAAYVLILRQAPLAAGCLFALAAMTRPEGAPYALIAGGLAAFAARHDRSRAGSLVMRFAGGFLALFLPYFAWRFAYYGYPLPNTYYVKAANFSWQRLATGARQLGEVSAWWSVYPLAALALVGAAAGRRDMAGAAAAGSPSTAPAAAPAPGFRLSLQLSALLVAATVLYFVYVGGDFLAFFGPRFFIPVLPFLLVLACAGLAVLCDQLARWTAGAVAARAARAHAPVSAATTARPARIVQRAAALAAALLIFANSLCLSWPARHFDAVSLALWMSSWEALGRHLGATTPPSTVLADGGAGIVPYFSHRVNIDMYGLADEHIGHMVPLAVGFKTTAHEKYDPRYVLLRRPDLLITYIDRSGTPRTGGLARTRDWVWACYRPLLLLRNVPSPPATWLLPSREFNTRLFDSGYQTAVLERRRGSDAAGCAAYESR